ncbi:MAG TPA: IPT/TIG domain-containing protein [Bryobacteraceae bacterium]|nr:IPT/TIG domain-containing protein [Bryobacteraceae bacterium]
MKCLALATFLCATLQAAAPSYTLAGICNPGNYAPGPFAPNSIVTIFGANLSRSTRQLTADDIQSGQLPTTLNYTQVFVDNYPAPLFYVSNSQINFLVPANQSVGPAKIRVVSEGNTGAEVTITVVDAAPALFAMSGGYAIATHADNTLVTADSPARAGEIIVIYATGLGKTAPNTATGEIPWYPAQISALSSLQVSLGGAVVDPGLVKYAGLTPQSAGLYQINLAIPGNPGTDPELRVTVAGQTSSAGLKLPIH